MTRWLDKIKANVRQTVSPVSASASSRPSPSPSPSQPITELATQITSQPATPPPTDSEPPLLLDLQERLWNQAYDEVKASEPKLVDTYERILSAGLRRDDTTSTSSDLIDNEIGSNRETRCLQMKKLVQEGLARTQKVVSIKRGIDEGSQAVQAVREIVEKAVHAAPAAAVAWVGVCLGLEILSNPVTEALANRKDIAYVLSRMEWYWALVSLLLDENKIEGSSVGLRGQLEKGVMQLYEKLLSYQMNSVCLYYRNWAAVIGRDMFKIDDWAGQLSKIQNAEAVVQRDMDQYNTEQSKIQMRTLIHTASALEMNLEGIHSAIYDQTRQQEKRYKDEKDEKCMKDLLVTDPRDDKKRIEGTKGGLIRDSYRWILDHTDFQRFRDDPQRRRLWIKGGPGKGKTMLLCGIIDELEKESAHCLSYFFCQATEAQLSNATAVLRGLIYLLIIQKPSLISYIRLKYDIMGEKLFQGINVWVSLAEILISMLKDPDLKDAVLIVDALDECITHRPQLLDFIIQASSNSSSRVKWIISSRNWPEIEERLNNEEQNVTLHLELNENSISQAVVAYIGHRVDQLTKVKNYDRKTRVAVESYLSANANDTFLWVALVCQELADPKVRRRHTHAKLKSFPPGLDALYERMMKQICDSEDSELCNDILAVASVAYRPVTLAELTALLKSPKTEDYDDLPEIIESCGSFLTIREDIIYFVHQSAKEYIIGKAPNQVLPSGTTHQHRTIFLRSLEAMSETLQRDIYNLRDPGYLIDQISPPMPDPLASIRYSCVYWVDHLHDSNPKAEMSQLQDSSMVYQFLKKKFLYWLESLSLLHSMPEGVLATQKLKNLKQTGANELTELLQDAHRFILLHKLAIELAPLQVYTSALIFSPINSRVRELFKEEEPDWIVLKPHVELNWNACLATLEGHSRGGISVAWSPDGQRLASSSYDSTIKIWDPITSTCAITLKGHSGPVESIAWSIDGQWLASSSDDSTIKIWDPATGACAITLEGHSNRVDSIAWSVDSQRLTSGSQDNTIKIWDLATGICAATLKGHSDGVNSVTWSTDGQQFASSSYDSTIKIWDPITGTCAITLKGHSGPVKSIAWSMDSQWLVSGSHDRTIKIWDPTAGICIITLKGHSGWVESIAWSANSQRLVSGSWDCTIKIWDPTIGTCIATLEGHIGIVGSIAWSADGQRLASGADFDHTIRIWDPTMGTYATMLEGHSDRVYSIAWLVDSQRLTSASVDNTIKIWDPATGACAATLKVHSDWITLIAWSADGQRLASGSYSTMKIWDPATGACTATLKGHGHDRVASIAWSADGQRLASASNGRRFTSGSNDQRLASDIQDGTIMIWDPATGACAATLEGHSGWITLIAWSADDQRLASASNGRRLASDIQDSTIMIWDPATGACTATLKGHGHHHVTSIAWSADSQRLASGSIDNTIKIWDPATGACAMTLEGHSKLVDSIAWSADGQRLASGSQDCTIKIWDPATGACIITLKLDIEPHLLSFDLVNTNCLVTNIGLLNLNTTSHKVLHCGYGISTDGRWVVQDGKNMLWLPSEYRTNISAIMGSTVALGCHSGRVLIMKFS